MDFVLGGAWKGTPEPWEPVLRAFEEGTAMMGRASSLPEEQAGAPAEAVAGTHS